MDQGLKRDRCVSHSLFSPSRCQERIKGLTEGAPQQNVKEFSGYHRGALPPISRLVPPLAAQCIFNMARNF